MSDEIQVPEELKGNVFITKLSQVYGWGRKYSLWPMFFGVACCAIEFMAAAASRFDTGRWGMDLARASPRQADLIVVSGTVTKKMAPKIVTLYNQMAEPKYVHLDGRLRLAAAGRSRKATTCSRASTSSCRWTSTCPAARPPRKPSSRAIWPSTKRSRTKRSTRCAGIARIRSRRVPVPVLGGPDLIDPRHIAEISAAARAAAGETEPVDQRRSYGRSLTIRLEGEKHGT